MALHSRVQGLNVWKYAHFSILIGKFEGARVIASSNIRANQVSVCKSRPWNIGRAGGERSLFLIIQLFIIFKKTNKPQDLVLKTSFEGLETQGSGLEEVAEQKGSRQNGTTAMIVVYTVSGFGGVVCVCVIEKYWTHGGLGAVLSKRQTTFFFFFSECEGCRTRSGRSGSCIYRTAWWESWCTWCGTFPPRLESVPRAWALWLVLQLKERRYESISKHQAVEVSVHLWAQGTSGCWSQDDIINSTFF